MAVPDAERRLAAILVADVVGYSRLTEADERGTLSAMRCLREKVIDPQVAEHHGRIAKLMGDGLVVEFGSVVDAVNCAVAVQQQTTAMQAETVPERRIVFRVGINLGDVVVEDDDLLGDGVNVAARLEQLCDPGGVLISGTSFDHLQGKFDLPLDYAGNQHVRNIARPVRTYRVRLNGVGLPWRLRLREHANRLRWVAGLAAFAVAAGIWVAFIRPAEVGPAIVASTPPTIAVLPFDDMGSNPGLSYFAEGVSDGIIAMLARVPDLTVVARTSSFAFKGQSVDVRKVGEELGATHVLEGSVRKEAERMRIVAQLVDARTGEHVWAERFDRTGNDPWALQDEVTEKIVAALVGYSGTLKRAEFREAWGKDTANLQEYDYYLRGHALDMQGTPEALGQAERIIAEGLSKFPHSSMLKVHLAAISVARHARGWSNSPEPQEDFRKAGELAKAALADPRASSWTQKFAHMVMAYVNLANHQLDQALREAETAIALAPYDGTMVYFLAEIPIIAGQPSRAIEWIDRAAEGYPEDDPRQIQLAAVRAWALSHEGKPEQALANLGDISHMLPSTLLLRASLLFQLGREDEAKADVKTLLERDPTWSQAKFRKRWFYIDQERVEELIRIYAALGLPAN